MARGPARTDWHSQPGPFMGGCQGPAGHCHAVCASPPWLAAWGSQRASERTLLPLTPRAGEPAVLCMSTAHLCAELSEHCLSVGRGWELWAGVQRRQEHPPCHGPGQPGGKPRWAHPLGAGSTTFGCLPACLPHKPGQPCVPVEGKILPQQHCTADKKEGKEYGRR